MDDRRRHQLLRQYDAEKPKHALPRAVPATSDTQGGLRYEDATDAREPAGGRKPVSPRNRARSAHIKKLVT